MGGGGRGMFAQHVPFDLEAFVPPFTFFFFPTFVPGGGWRGKEVKSSLRKTTRSPYALDTNIILHWIHTNTHTALKAAFVRVYLSVLSELFQTRLPPSVHYFSFLCPDSALGLFLNVDIS